jgi:hypothetical protein
MDCGVDCSFATGIGHFHTVHRHIWLSVAPGSNGRLCLDCLQPLPRRASEKRRGLTPGHVDSADGD